MNLRDIDASIEQQPHHYFINRPIDEPLLFRMTMRPKERATYEPRVREIFCDCLRGREMNADRAPLAKAAA